MGCDGRAEVHVPLRALIAGSYAENSTLGAVLRVWRSRAASVPAGTGKCKPRGSNTRRGVFPCAAPVFDRVRGRRSSSRGRQRESDRKVAEELLTLQAGIASRIACGSTATPPKNLPTPASGAHLSMLSLAQEQALRLTRASRVVRPAIDSGRTWANFVDACGEMGDDYLGTLRKTGRAGAKMEAERLS